MGRADGRKWAVSGWEEVGRADGRKWAGLMGGSDQGWWEEVDKADGRKWQG